MTVVCRLCAKSQSIAEIKTTINDIGWNIEAKLIYCCQWSPLRANDALPKEVCKICFDKLDNCWSFAQSVSVAQTKLKEIYEWKPLIPIVCYGDNEHPNPNSINRNESDDHLERIKGGLQNQVKKTARNSAVEQIMIKTEQSSNDEADFSEFRDAEESVEIDCYVERAEKMEPKETKQFICLECGEVFRSKYRLKKHVSLTNHVGELPKMKQKIPKAEKKVKRKQSAVDSTNTTKPRRIRKPSTKIYTCTDCKEFFISPYKYKKHVLFKCKIAKMRRLGQNIAALQGGVAIKRESNSEEENPTNTVNQAMFECDRCDAEFKTEEQRRIHIESDEHLPHSDFCCYLCKRPFAKQSQLLSHVKTHLKRVLFECKYCFKPFGFARAYRNHMLRKHNLDKATARQIITDLGPIAYRHGRFVCEFCGKCFTENIRLRSHKVIHSDDRPHKCEECGKCFKLKSILKTHMRVHTGERNFPCTLCNKRFTAKVILERHMETHNGNIAKPFQCDYCDKSFRTLYNLTNHRRTHTGEKPYRCEPCNYATPTYTQLQNHLKSKRHFSQIKEAPSN